MFFNVMTRKMPCWKCKDRDECNIYDGITLDNKTRQHISELTFKCDKFNEVITRKELEAEDSPFPFMDKDGKRWWIDEQHYRVACGCVIFTDMAGSHHEGFCKYHQAQVDKAMHDGGDK